MDHLGGQEESRWPTKAWRWTPQVNHLHNLKKTVPDTFCFSEDVSVAVMARETASPAL
jgi:hypothetical protein